MAKSTKAHMSRPAKGEDPAVTIANQQREIDNFIQRIQALVNECDETRRELRSALALCEERSFEIRSHKAAGEKLCDKIKQMEDAHTRLLGWQDCAREIIQRIGE